jgi:hypothetical protein
MEEVLFFFFFNPEEPVTVKRFTGQQKLIAGILFVFTGEAALEQHDASTDTVQLNVTLDTN